MMLYTLDTKNLMKICIDGKNMQKRIQETYWHIPWRLHDAQSSQRHTCGPVHLFWPESAAFVGEGFVERMVAQAATASPVSVPNLPNSSFKTSCSEFIRHETVHGTVEICYIIMLSNLLSNLWKSCALIRMLKTIDSQVEAQSLSSSHWAGKHFT